MKIVVFALIAMACYAVANVVLEMKFSKYNNLTLMVCYSLPIFVAALVGRQITKTADPSFSFPVGYQFLLVIGLGLIFAIADYFYVGAYTNGGSLLTITSITMMFPILASAIKFGFTHKAPNAWQIAGYVLAALAVFLVTKGSTIPSIASRFIALPIKATHQGKGYSILGHL